MLTLYIKPSGGKHHLKERFCVFFVLQTGFIHNKNTVAVA
jgi:hypothetical protein